MAESPDDHIICATYTHARRHPLVLGHIAGWTPPFQLSLAQLGVLAVTIWIEMQTWDLWGPRLPRGLGVAIAVGLPCGLAWAVRRARIEGRSLARAAVGYLMLACAPRSGHVGGRAYRPSRPSGPGRQWVFVAPGGDDA